MIVCIQQHEIQAMRLRVSYERAEAPEMLRTTGGPKLQVKHLDVTAYP